MAPARHMPRASIASTASAASVEEEEADRLLREEVAEQLLQEEAAALDVDAQAAAQEAAAQARERRMSQKSADDLLEHAMAALLNVPAPPSPACRAPGDLGFGQAVMGASAPMSMHEFEKQLSAVHAAKQLLPSARAASAHFEHPDRSGGAAAADDVAAEGGAVEASVEEAVVQEAAGGTG